MSERIETIAIAQETWSGANANADRASLSRPQSQYFLTLIFASLTVLFALQQTGLGVIDYLPTLLQRTLQAILVGAMLAMASLGIANFKHLSREQAQIVLMFVGLNLFYGASSILWGGIRFLFNIECIVLTLALVPVMNNPRIWQALLRGLFYGGMTLIMLNMVPLLHWAGIVNMHPEFIPRLINTSEDISALDAYSFGIFGRSESFEVIDTFFGRLQGFALEPLHWGYFAMLTIAIGMLLYSQSRGPRERFLYGCAFAIVAVHLYFIHSASTFFTLAAWLIAVALLGVVRRWRSLRKREAFLLFATVILGTGFVVPFLLSLIPDIENLLYAEQITGKGSNWSMKIGFLGLGRELFTRFLPSNQPDMQTSHNLVLEMYLHYGYFFITPLLAFFYVFFKRVVAGAPMGFSAVALLILMCHLILVPNAFFYPGGILFFGLALMLAEYRNRNVKA